MGVETDAEGYFEFQDLPAGYYVITVNVGGGWAQLTAENVSLSERVLVEAGENKDIGKLITQ